MQGVYKTNRKMRRIMWAVEILKDVYIKSDFIKYKIYGYDKHTI